MTDSQQVTVSIEKTATSVTVRDDGTSDVMYARLITDVDTGDVIVRDVVRETVETATVISELESLKAIEPSSDA